MLWRSNVVSKRAVIKRIVTKRTFTFIYFSSVVKSYKWFLCAMKSRILHSTRKLHSKQKLQESLHPNGRGSCVHRPNQYPYQTCPNNSIERPNNAQSRPITQSLDWVIGIGGSRLGLGLGLGFFGFFGISRIGLPPKMCPSNLPQIGGDAHVKAVSGASTYALLMSLLWMWSQNHCKASNVPTEQPFWFRQ